MDRKELIRLAMGTPAVKSTEKSKYIVDDPDIMKFWDWEKNTDLNPTQLVRGSHKAAHWLCKVCGWRKKTSIKARAMANGLCPCHDSGKVVVAGYNDFLTVIPEAAYYYNQDDNSDVEPGNYGVSDERTLVWHCRNNCGNTWSSSCATQFTRLADGTYDIRKCPCEKGQTVAKNLSEDKRAPLFWDYESNDHKGKRITDYKIGSNAEVDWRCPKCDYNWSSSIKDQVKATYFCPCCERNQVIRKGVNDLFTTHPIARKYFDYERNANINPETVYYKNQTLIDWKCPVCGKRWSQKVRNLCTESGEFKGCSKCNSLARGMTVIQNKEMMKFWDKERNTKDPSLLSAYDREYDVHWKCNNPQCGHTWTTKAAARVNRKYGCPACDAGKDISTGYNDALTLCADLSRCILQDDNPGVDLSILSRIAINDNTHILSVRCPNCGGIKRPATLKNSVSTDKQGNYRVNLCIECARYRSTPYYEDYPEMKEMWDEEANGCSIDSVPRSAESEDYCWTCSRIDCKMPFQSSISTVGRAFLFQGSNGCPYCAKLIVRPGESFGDLHPELLAEYSKENEINPFDAFPYGKTKVVWSCKSNRNHPNWTASFAERHTGTGKCPICFPAYAIPGINTVFAHYPELNEVWSDRNLNAIDQTIYRPNKAYVWVCRKCGVDVAVGTVKEYLNGETSCSCCNGTKAFSGINTFDVTQPNQLHNWDYIANYALGLPSEIMENLREPRWWTCDNNPNHHYPMSPFRRTVYLTRHQEPCPYCKGRRRKLRRSV